jgi:hypothetical protein
MATSRSSETRIAPSSARPAALHLDLQGTPSKAGAAAKGVAGKAARTASTDAYAVRDPGLRRGFAAFAGKVLREGAGTLTVTTAQGPRKLRLQVVPDDASDQAAAAQPPVMDPKVAEAVARARTRGQEAAAAILDGPDMRTGAELGALMGMSRQAVHKAASEGRLLALSGGARAVRYPAWQLDETGARLDGLAEVVAALGQGWPSHRFLVAPGADGRTAWERLAAGETAAVLGEARAQAQGHYG